MNDGWEKDFNQNKRQSDHDLLTQIDTKLSILLISFQQHINDDKITFEKHDSRLKKLEGLVWVGTGIVVALQVIIKLIR